MAVMWSNVSSKTSSGKNVQGSTHSIHPHDRMQYIRELLTDLILNLLLFVRFNICICKKSFIEMQCFLCCLVEPVNLCLTLF